MKKYSFIIITILLITTCSEPGASDLEQAKLLMTGDSLTMADTARAIEHLTLAAESGNAEAMYRLAYYCQYGIGTEKNSEQAMNWYRRSAEAGSHQAQNKMGMVYYTGSGTGQDYGSAREWFIKSARGGNDQAQYMLGKIYSAGEGIEPDTARAVKWLKKVSGAAIPTRNSCSENCSMNVRIIRKTSKKPVTGSKKAPTRGWGMRRNCLNK
ncbi:MAG: tetratricopeptide repeat protein [Candidatus Marinimicrobia bacterium]|nr:tetratricopeptide repeat protein [Candidatus Neomarinimicrobiota bacterium]